MNMTKKIATIKPHRRALPPALRTAINRMAHEQAVRWEMTQRATLTQQALGLWSAGAGVEAIEARLRQSEAVERLREVVP